MKAKWILLAVVVSIALPLAAARSNSGDDNNSHQYTIRVDGAPGAQLRMLLVTKPSARQAPERETRVITTPFQTTVKASSFYVWFDSDGRQTQAGQRIEGGYLLDGEPQGGGFGAAIKKGHRQTFGYGTL